MPCDRNEECLSGLCSALGNETKRCHELADVENQQSIDITGMQRESVAEAEDREEWFDLTWIIPIVVAAAVVVFLILRQRGYWANNPE